MYSWYSNIKRSSLYDTDIVLDEQTLGNEVHQQIHKLESIHFSDKNQKWQT